MVMQNFKHLNQYTFGDSVEILKTLPDKSVDLIFTSPPDLSQTEFTIPEFKDWLENNCDIFSRVIKDDGFIVISQQDRKVNGTILSNHWWYIKWLTERGLELKDEKILVRNKVERVDLYKFTYQYFSCFTKKGKIAGSKRKGEWLKDIIVDPEDRVADQYIWSIPFCSLVINTLTEPGDFIIDPFAGYAPTLYAAKLLGRDYWGGEFEESRYNKDFQYFLKNTETKGNNIDVWFE